MKSRFCPPPRITVRVLPLTPPPRFVVSCVCLLLLSRSSLRQPVHDLVCDLLVGVRLEHDREDDDSFGVFPRRFPIRRVFVLVFLVVGFGVDRVVVSGFAVDRGFDWCESCQRYVGFGCEWLGELGEGGADRSIGAVGAVGAFV